MAGVSNEDFPSIILDIWKIFFFAIDSMESLLLQYNVILGMLLGSQWHEEIDDRIKCAGFLWGMKSLLSKY